MSSEITIAGLCRQSAVNVEVVQAPGPRWFVQTGLLDGPSHNLRVVACRDADDNLLAVLEQEHGR